MRAIARSGEDSQEQKGKARMRAIARSGEDSQEQKGSGDEEKPGIFKMGREV